MTSKNNDFFIGTVSVRSIVIRSKPSHNWSCGRDEWLIRRRVFELKKHGRKFGVIRNGGFSHVDAYQMLDREDHELLDIRRNAFSSDG